MGDYKPDPMFNDPPEQMPLKEEIKTGLTCIFIVALVLGVLAYFDVI